MGFFKSINNFAKSAMGDTKAMIEQGHWMMKNGQIDAGINCFSGAAIKGDQEAMVLWGNALIEHGNADVDTLCSGLSNCSGLTNLDTKIAL